MGLAQQRMMPESLTQTGAVSGSGVTLGPTASSTATSMLGVEVGAKTDLAFDLVGGLSLRRTSEIERQDVFGQKLTGTPFGYLYHQTDATNFTFSLTGRSHLSYTSSTTQDMNFGLAVRGTSSFQGFAFDQGLGSGSSALTMGFSTGTREVTGAPGTATQSFHDQALSLAGNAGSVGPMKFGYTSTTPDDPKATATRNLAASLTPKFSGGQGLLSWTQADTSAPGVDTTQVNTDLVLPMRLAGNTVRTEYHRQSLTGTTNTDAISMLLASPLDMLTKGASFSYAQSTQTAAGVQTGATDARSFILPLTRFIPGGSFAWSDNDQYTGTALVTGKSTTDLVLPLKLLDPKASFQWHFSSITAASVRTDSRVANFAMPLDRFDLTGGSFSWQSVGAIAAGVDTLTRTTTVSAPLFRLYKGSSVSWQDVTTEQPGLEGDSRILTLVAPLHLASRTIGGTYTTQTTTTNGADTNQDSLVFNIPVQKVQAIYGVTHIEPFSATGAAQPTQDITALNLPPVRLFTNALQAGFAETRTDTEGQPEIVSTTISSLLTPSKRLQFAGQLQQTAGGPGQDSHAANFKADFAVMPSLSLNWRYLESQAVGAPATAQRYYGLSHEVKGSLPLQMKVGYTTYDTPTATATGTPQDGAMSVQVALGKPDRTSVIASYSEFDQNSLALLPQEVVALALTQRLGGSLGLRWDYQDQPGRIAPLCGVTLAGALLGSNVTVSHVSNPQDPRNPALVRDADQWDAAVKRKFLGLDVDLGYRYCEFRNTPDGVEQYMRLSLAGGQPTRGGQLKLTLLTGDFVPAVAVGVNPGMALQVDFGKQWGENCQFNLTVRHSAVPTGIVTPDDSTEGRAEIKVLW
jgi:hypothetical protein